MKPLERLTVPASTPVTLGKPPAAPSPPASAPAKLAATPPAAAVSAAPRAPEAPARTPVIAPLPKRARTATRDGERSSKRTDPMRITSTSKRVDPTKLGRSSSASLSVPDVPFDDLDEATNVFDSGTGKRAGKQASARKGPETPAIQETKASPAPAVQAKVPEAKAAPAPAVPEAKAPAPAPPVKATPVPAPAPPVKATPAPAPAPPVKATPVPAPDVQATPAPAAAAKPAPQRKGTMQAVDEGFEDMLGVPVPPPAPVPVPPPVAPAPAPPVAAAIAAFREEPAPRAPSPRPAVPVEAPAPEPPTPPAPAEARPPLDTIQAEPSFGLLAQRIAVIAGPGGEPRIVALEANAAVPAGGIAAIVVPLQAGDGEALARLLLRR
jgi:hypothetical protein